ncbi:MAG TPA: 6-phosphogluconolactonase [Desulfomonilaceae bacterium]|nr:6-phosphogluconolactonase [Desulfomonilaceae bacterium]
MHGHESGEIQVYSSAQILGSSAADLFVETAQTAVEERGRFSVALSGGSSPLELYTFLVRKSWSEKVPWRKTHVFWGDERCVSLNDSRSNAGSALQLLLAYVPVPGSHIHPILCQSSPKEAAADYEKLIKDFFVGQMVRFDLIILGLGENGHTASLFPEHPVLDETKHLVKEVFLSASEVQRVTLTAPAINQAARVVFLVHGAHKAQVLHDVLEGAPEPRLLPAQLIRPSNGELLWLVDEQAAAKLNR